MSSGDIFLTTRWTQVLAAQGTSTTALADLCAAYYASDYTHPWRKEHRQP